MPDFKRSFDRIVAARERLIEVRGERIEALLRLRMFIRAKLADFLSSVDPISSARYADLTAEGSKAYGDMSLTLTFFDGTRLRVGVDSSARVSLSTTPDLTGDIEQVLDIRVRADLGSAEFDYIPKLQGETTEEQPVRTGDFADLLDALVERAVAATENQIGTMQVQTFEVARRTVRRPGLSFNIR